jgi:maltoporin
VKRALLLAGLLSAGVPSLSAAEDSPFLFGSYGRVGLTTDGEGSGEKPQIVAWAPRLNEGNYLELDFGYHGFKSKDARVWMMSTLALGDRFFHFDGNFDSAIAIRQAFLQADALFGTGWFTWVGSRMYRGDDIYLFDVWPMDDLNTMGAAVGWKDGRTEATLHLGLNRLDSTYQVQRVPVPANDTFAEDVTLLDRQRRLVSARLERRWGGGEGELGLKVRLHLELHHLPSGERALPGTSIETETVRDDLGWLVGAQLGLWNFAEGQSHLNLWLRAAGGLAAYDELAAPGSLNTERRSVDAREYRVALSGNLESGRLGLAYGGYTRIFLDADADEEDFDDRVEVAMAVRPQLFYGAFTPAVEASIQMMRPNGLNPRTEEQAVARVVQLGLVPALTFSEQSGTYARPQIRFIYTVSLLNQPALDLYAAEDPRADADTVHFVGLRAEWWFGRGGGY